MNEAHERLWRATTDISALFEVLMVGSREHAPYRTRLFRRERATIWRRYGLTYRAFHWPARRIGRVRRGRI